ncbi:ead/Ea22-like family protein [Salmonella enterica subsp. diarizonae]|nr:ead/Ea22-like family protein [Salmonella enterica subsp. diarizonae]EDY3377225.1 ead/Ea22-like family protein [Salmonella enterica]EEM9509689.1 ead/Ea22-like family protein [Salmonella enterica]ELF3919287.1 ead/Ea22-like family protein [Salmonella enterica]
MNIDKRALREVAERATPGNWRRTSSLFNGITATPFSLCGEEVTLAHTVEKRDAEFIAAANPATMLALLDELDVKEEQRANWFQMAQKLGEDLDAAERNIAETNRLNAELTARIEPMDRRIAELEAREVTLPQRLQPGADGYDDWYVHSEDDGEYLKADDVIEAIRAADIKVKE